MKRILLLFFMFVLAMTAVAQSTQKITYQAVVRDGANRLVVNTPVRVDVTITSSAGSYFESLRDTTNANGLMYVLIGGNPGFENIDWVEAVIKTVVTIEGGETVTDEVTVTAVPLALQAGYATNVSPSAPTIVAVYNQMQADSLALANRIAAERAHLDDTLSHYLMQEVQVLSISNDTIYLTGGSFVKLPAGFSGDYNDLTNKPDLNVYATNVHLNDTLSHYLMQEVQVLSVSNDTLYLTGGSWVKLPQGFSGDYNDLINKPTNVSAFINDAGYLTNDSAVIVNLNTNVTNLQGDVTNLQTDVTNLQNADNVLSSRITADSTNLANNYYNKTDLNDTLRRYATLKTLNDTLSHYLMEEVQVLSVSNDTLYLTGGSWVKLPQGFSGDYNDLTNKPLKSDLCDSVKPCVTDWMNDTLKAYTTTNKIDTLLGAYATNAHLNDTLKAYTTTNKIDTLLGAYATNVHLNDTLSHYLMQEVQVISISNDTIYLTGGSFVKLPAGFSGDYNDLTNKPDLDQYATNVHLNDTLSRYTTTNKIDTLLGAYATNAHLNDTLSHYLMQEVQVLSVSNDTLYLTGGSWVKLPQGFSGDYNDLTNKPDLDQYATNVHLNDTLSRYTTTNKIDTLLGAYATNAHLNDTLSHYLMQEVQVLSVSNDTLYLTGGSWVKLPQGFSGDYNDLTNVPTDLVHDANYHHTDHNFRDADSIKLAGIEAGAEVNVQSDWNQTDATADNYIQNKPTNVSTFTNDAGYLTEEVQVLRISNDTIYLTGGSFVKLPAGFSGDYNDLTNRPLKSDLCDSVKPCVTDWMNDTLKAYTTTNKIDTLIRKYGYLTSDSAVIVTMRDSIQKVNNRLTYDSTRLADRIHADSTALAHRMDTLLKHVCDSVKPCVTELMNDTLKAYTTSNKIDTLLGAYATNAHLNDTLKAYTTTNKIDTLIRKYGYLTSDSAVIVTMRDSIQKVNNRLTYDSTRLADRILADSTALAHRMDTLLKYVCDSVKPCVTELMNDTLKAYTTSNKIDTLLGAYATNAHLNDTLKAYTTTNKIDTLIRKYGYLTSDSAVIVTMRDSIQKVNKHVSEDSLILAQRIYKDSLAIMDTLHKYYATNDTLKNYYTRYQVDTAKAHIRNEIQNGTLTITYGSTVTTFTANQPTGSDVSVTIPTPAEQVQADWKETDVLKTSFIRNKPNIRDSVNRVVLDSLYAANSAMNKAVDTIARNNIHDSLVVVRTKIHTDSTALATRVDTLLKHVCDSVKPCVTELVNDTLKAYTTTNKIDTLIRKYGYLTSDSAIIVTMRDSIQKVNNRLTYDSTALAHRMDTLLKHVCDSVKPCVTGWMNDTLKAYTTSNKIDTLLGAYATNAHLNDTLKVYTTTNKIDTLIQKYGYTTIAHLNDTLRRYTTTNQIDTLVKKYGYLTSDSAVIVRMRDSIQKVNNRLTYDSTALAHRMDTLLKHVCDSVKPCVTELVNDTLKAYTTSNKIDTLLGAYATNAHLNDTLRAYTTTNKIDTLIQKYGYTTIAHLNDTLRRYTTTNQVDTLIKKYGYLTSDSAVIVMMRDSIQKVNNRLTYDSTALAHRMDTLLKHVCDSVKPCVTELINDTLKAYTTSNKIDTLLGAYATNAHLNDTLKAYTTTNKIDTLIQKYGYTTIAHLNDTLRRYTTTNQVDTLIKKYGYLTSDSAVIVMMRDSIQKVNNRLTYDSTKLAERIHDDSLLLAQKIRKDSVTVMDTLHKYYTTNAHLNDTLKAYTTTNKIDTLLGAYATKVALRDSTRMVFDTLHKYYATKDTLKNFVRKDALCTDVMDCTDIKTMRDSIQKVNNRLTYDSTKLAERIHDDSLLLAQKIRKDSVTVMDTLHKYYTTNAHLNDTLKAYTTTNKIDTLLGAYATKVALRDSTRMVFDTLHKYYATKDTLKNYVKKDALCTEVMACTDIKTMRDSIQKVNNRLTYDSTKLAEKIRRDSVTVMDTLHKYYTTNAHLNDTLKAYTTTNKIDTLLGAYATKVALRDSTRMVFDTLHKYYATKDTLKNFVRKADLCKDVMACDGIQNMRDSIQKVNTRLTNDSTALANRMNIIGDSVRKNLDSIRLNRKAIIDTAANIRRDMANYEKKSDLCKDVMACDGIQNMRDSIQKVNTRLTNDSTALANRMNIIGDSVRKNLDTIRINRKAIIDTAANIRNSIGDGQITITKNGQTIQDGSFNVNQKTPQTQTINIEVPTTVAELTDEANYAKVAADNQFTGTNTVPRGFVIKGENATNGDNCNNIVVNACDLWAVFDSLNRRMKALEDELATIKSATPPVFNSITLSDITTNSMKVTSSFTSTGVDITSYRFCYSKNSNMSGSTCITTGTSEITLTGLDPFTRYYVDVTATNMIGTTTSTIADAKTLADAPTATVTGETTAPSGITVTLSNLNFKQPGEGTVQIYYKKKTDATCSTDLDGYTALTPSGTISSGDPYSQTISGLEDETVYCVIVKLQNENNVTYKDPIEVTSGPSNYLIVTSRYYSDINDDDIWLCKNAPVSVTYTVNPLIGDIEDYEDFSWRYYQSDNAVAESHALPTVSSEVANGSSYTITISATSSSHDAISIECTAKHKVTGALIKGNWEDLRTRNQVQQNIPTADFDVTYLTVTALTSYSKVDWGDGSAVQEGVASGTEHLYQDEGTYTVTLINIYPDYYGGAGCIATGTVTVETPPENIYVCSGTPHQGGVYEGQGFNGANDGYEEGSNGQITSVTDYDGNVYPVVQIGSQCWIAKNLRCEHSPNTGNYIVNRQNKTGDDYFKTYASKSAHWLHNDPSIASSDTGLLYNFCAAADVYNGTELNTLNQTSWTPTINTPYHRGICPKGWHLPTYDDWNTLRNNEKANTAAKIAGDGWPSPPGGCGNNHPCGTLNHNLSGFSALFTCYMNYNGWNTLRTDGTGFWSSTCTSGKASGCVLTTGSGSLPLSNNYYQFRNLFSVRCIRNEGDDPSGDDPTPTPAEVSLSVTSDHSQVQLCTTNGNSLYPTYAPVEVTYTATLSCEDPNTELTGYSYNWSITPSGYSLTTDGGNTCTVTYSTEPGSQPHISCTATKADVDVSGSYNQSFANPSKVFPEYVLCVDTMSVMLRTNSNAFGIQSDYTINWGDGSAPVTGLTSTKTSGPQHPYAEPGTYSVTVTNAAGCPLTKQATVAHAISTRFPCTGTAHQGTEYQSYGLTQKDGYEYTNSDGITAVTDYDGNVYPVVQIGNKCWMKENLRCTHSPNTGTSIVNPLNASGNSFTRSKTSKVAQWYQNNQTTSESMGYGLYYNWCAAMDIYYPGGNELPQAGQSETDWAYTVSDDHRGICPRGWHVPSQDEFNTLLSNAGGGTALAGSCQWNYCFGNSKDFYAIPSGMSTSSGGFHSNSLVANGGVMYAYYWSSTEYGSNKDRVYPLQLYNASVGDNAYTSVSASTTYGGSFKEYGHSVRCVRDSE